VDEAMKLVIARVALSALVAAVSETVASGVRSHSFHLLAAGMYAVIEFLFFFIVMCIAAFISSRVSSALVWVQRIVFFGIVLAPSVLSYFAFYRAVAYYQEGGSVLVTDHQITTAGMETLALSVGISAVVAIMATVIYFRPTAPS
jgi:hypothetical protein